MRKKSRGEISAFIFFGVTLFFVLATFAPLVYSILFPNDDIQAVLEALKGARSAPMDAERLVDYTTRTVGLLKETTLVAAYFSSARGVHLSGGQVSEKVTVSQATYLARFQNMQKRVFVSIAQYVNERGQKQYSINEVEPSVIIRGYAIPLFLFASSLVLLRTARPSSTLRGK